MNEVKRYDAGCDYAGEEDMVERADGDFVRHEDYATLQEKLTATTNSLTDAQEALKSAGIEADTVQAGVMGLKDKLTLVREQRDSELNRNTWLEAKLSFKEDLTSQIVELRKELVEAAGRNIALRDERNTLVAENAAMNEVISAVRGVARNSEGIAGWHLNGNIAGWDEILPEIDDVETPATDAYLNAVRAEGVDMVAESLIENGVCTSSHTVGYFKQFAALLRAGNAGKDGSHE